MLVGRRLDPWLTGQGGVVAWVLLSTVPGLRNSFPGALYWALLAVTAVHFGITYHLAYGDARASMRRHPVPLVVLPVAIGILVVLVIASDQARQVLMPVALTTVFGLTTWHYARQAYGVSRLAASARSVRIEPTTALLLRYGLYPLWALSLARLFTPGPRGDAFGYRLGASILPAASVSVLDVLAAVTGVAFVLAVLAQWRRHAPIPAVVWGPQVAGLLWLGRPPGYTGTLVVLAALHGLQYLAVAYRAESATAAHRDQEQPLTWMLAVFGASGAMALFASNWLGPYVAVVTGSSQQMWSGLLFVGMNLHHYAIDASIWRSDGQLLTRMRTAPPSSARPDGRTAAHPVPSGSLIAT